LTLRPAPIVSQLPGSGTGVTTNLAPSIALKLKESKA